MLSYVSVVNIFKSGRKVTKKIPYADEIQLKSTNFALREALSEPSLSSLIILNHTKMTITLIPLLSLPGGSEWIIIALVVLLLFGGKKIPELMKGLGKGVRSFKDGLNDATREVKDAADAVNDDAKK